jgi:hypothetical protein
LKRPGSAEDPKPRELSKSRSFQKFLEDQTKFQNKKAANIKRLQDEKFFKYRSVSRSKSKKKSGSKKIGSLGSLAMANSRISHCASGEKQSSPGHSNGVSIFDKLYEDSKIKNFHKEHV